MELQKLYVTLTLEAKKYADGLKGAVSEAQSAGGRIANALGDNMRRAGQLMATGLAVGTVALGAFVASGVTGAMNLEAQLSGIAAVLGTTADQIEPLKNLISELSLNPNLKVNTTEAASAIEMLARNGLDMAQIMDGAALSVVALANATGGEFALSADVMTDAMAQFGIEAADLGVVVDGITGVVTNSKFTMDDFAYALAQGGGVAGSAGVEFDDFATSIAAMSPLFASGQDAGTSFKTMIVSMAKPTDEAQKLMDALGLSFYDASGNMLSMDKIAGQLNTAMSGLSEQQRTTALSTIFGTDAMRAAAGLAAYTEEEFRALGDSVNASGSAMDSSATRMDNLSGDLEIFRGIVESAGIQMGTAMLPFLRTFVQYITGLATEYLPMLLGGLESFMALFESVTAMVQSGASVWEVLTIILGNLGLMGWIPTLLYIKELATAFVEFVQPLVDFAMQFVTLQDVMIAFALAVGIVVIPIIWGIMAPILAVIAVFALVVAAIALLRTAWEQNWGGIQEKTAAVIAFIMPLVQNALLSIQAWWAENGAAIMAAVSAHVEFVIAVFTNWFNFIMPLVQQGLAAISAWWTENGAAVMATVSAMWEFISQGFTMAIDNLKLILTAFFQFLVGDFEGAKNTVITLVNGWWDTVKTIFNTAVTNIQTAFSSVDWGAIGTSIVQGMANGIRNGAAWIVDAARAAAQSALDAAKSLLGINSPSTVFMDIGMDAGLGMAMGLDAMQGVVSGAVGNMIPVGDYATASAMPMSGRSGGVSSYTANTTVNVASGDDPLRALRASRLLDKIGI